MKNNSITASKTSVKRSEENVNWFSRYRFLFFQLTIAIALFGILYTTIPWVFKSEGNISPLVIKVLVSALLVMIIITLSMYLSYYSGVGSLLGACNIIIILTILGYICNYPVNVENSSSKRIYFCFCFCVTGMLMWNLKKLVPIAREKIKKMKNSELIALIALLFSVLTFYFK